MPRIYKIPFIVSIFVVVAFAAILSIFGLNMGIDFTGGSLLEIRYFDTKPSIEQINDVFRKLKLDNVSIFSTQDKGFIFRMKEISEQKHQEILNELKKFGDLEEKRFDVIGSTLGKELKSKSISAIIIALFLISLYLAIVFRRIGRVISPFSLSLGAIAALVHDLLIVVGVFVILGKWKGIQIDAPMIAAALTILGYSINDTVVIFDRIRENVISHNIRLNKNADSGEFNSIVHKSIKQTLNRSISTSLTTLFVIIAIYVFGGATLKNFSLALIIGIVSGTYSSIFIASPILMWMHRRRIRI